MRLKPIIILLLLCAILGVIAPVSAVPPLPCSCYGIALLDGSPAPAGTLIEAKIDWNVKGNTIIQTAGNYGTDSTFGNVLLVSATEDDIRATSTPTITFWIGTIQAAEEALFTTGGKVRQNLTFTSPAGEGTDTDTTPVGSETCCFDLEEVTTTESGGTTQVSVDTQGTTTATATSDGIILENPGAGWERLEITTTAPPETSGNQITGSVASVRATTEPVTGTIEELGEVQGEITLTLSDMPQTTSSLATTIVKEPDSGTKSIFTLLAEQEDRNGEVSIAYVMQVDKTGLANVGDGGLIQNAVITMRVPNTWVEANGGNEAVRILRSGDDGLTTALTILSVTESGGITTFTASSPLGLSSFALMTIHAGTPGSVSPSVPSSSDSGGSSGGPSSQSSVSSYISSETPVPAAPAKVTEPVIETAPEPVPVAVQESVAQEPAEPESEPTKASGFLQSDLLQTPYSWVIIAFAACIVAVGLIATRTSSLPVRENQPDRVTISPEPKVMSEPVPVEDVSAVPDTTENRLAVEVPPEPHLEELFTLIEKNELARSRLRVTREKLQVLLVHGSAIDESSREQIQVLIRDIDKELDELN